MIIFAELQAETTQTKAFVQAMLIAYTACK